MAVPHQKKSFNLFLVCALIVPPLVLLYQKRQLLNQLQNLTHRYSNYFNEDILIFARVPKTASLTINTLLNDLGHINQFWATSNPFGIPEFSSKGEVSYIPQQRLR